MNTSNIVFLAEFAFTFVAVLAFALWQLQSLEKLDRRDAENRKSRDSDSA